MILKPTPYFTIVVTEILKGLSIQRITKETKINLFRFNQGLRDECFTDEEKVKINRVIEKWKSELKNQPNRG